MAASMILCSVASSGENSPVNRPSLRTRIRSLTVSSSGNSLDVMMTESPCHVEPIHQAIEFRLGPDVDARVGSPSSKTFGWVNSHLPTIHFCWLPPERLVIRARGPDVFTNKSPIDPAIASFSRALLTMPNWPTPSNC